MIAAWAGPSGRLSQVEVLGYCDEGRSVDWIAATGVRRMNLLVKGSERHCRLQLGLSLDQHVAQIRGTLAKAGAAGVELSGVYLEDWSGGMAESPDYVAAISDSLWRLGVRRLYLADTLGVLAPAQVRTYVRRMRRWLPDVALELHAHDDYGLATANCLAAAAAGIDGLHVTVNGLGERAGNAVLAEVAVALRDHTSRRSRVDEPSLHAVSQLVSRASRCSVAHNAPIVGEHVFTQTAGIHADGDAKGRLYCSELVAERFARRRQYALGKLSGRATLAHHLEALALSLSPIEQRVLLERVVALGDQKQRVRREDLPRLLHEGVLGPPGDRRETGPTPLDARN
jgi:D-citramalate synthase